jgi:PEP-CTERM motif
MNTGAVARLMHFTELHSLRINDMRWGNKVKRTTLLLAILVGGLCTASASALTIELHNTGVDSSDNLVSAGGVTSFWTLFSQPANTAGGDHPYRYFNGTYFADTADSAWVSPNANGSAGASGNYLYRLAVDLTGFNLSTVSISGIFGTDNDGDIWINDEGPSASTGFGGFGTPTDFSFDSGFVSGVNYIYVRMNNGGDPTAFHVRFGASEGDPDDNGPPTEVPEPGTLMLIGLGLVGIRLASRRRLA